MRAALLSISVLLLTLVVSTQAQHDARPSTPAIVPELLTGAASYDLYCASCHGMSGVGDGPIAASLRTRPADLSQVSRRHEGVFPRDAIRAYIDGRDRRPSAHGSSDMPVWGPIFSVLETSDPRARVRIDNLVAFIESLQRPADTAAPQPQPIDGAALFANYCASCHGKNGRGGGPVGEQLRRPPADLTKLAAHNKGVFPAAEVARIIDGRSVVAHGTPEMPVWGDVFRRDGATRVAAAARVDALVKYLIRIQERPAE